LLKMGEDGIKFSGLKDVDKASRIKDFKERGIWQIMNALKTQERREVVQLVNGIFLESTETVRRTQRHDFIDEMRKKGIDMGEILTTAIDGGEVNIYAVQQDPIKSKQLG